MNIYLLGLFISGCILVMYNVHSKLNEPLKGDVEERIKQLDTKILVVRGEILFIYFILAFITYYFLR